MIEAWVALGLLALLGAAGATLVIGPETLLLAGFWISAGGLGFGVPTGLLYHLALRRALLRAGRLPRRWWLRPTALHDAIPPAERLRVLGWCGAGAAGFAISLLGCVLVAIGAFRIG